MGEHARIDAFVTLTGRLKIGDRVHLATGCCLFGSSGLITLSDGCGFSPYSLIFTGTTDPHSDLVSTPGCLKTYAKCAPVFFGVLVTLGAHAVILPGTVIGDESQIGSNSTVKGQIPARQIWAGNPAKYIGPRKPLDWQASLGYQKLEAQGA